MKLITANAANQPAIVETSDFDGCCVAGVFSGGCVEFISGENSAAFNHTAPCAVKRAGRLDVNRSGDRFSVRQSKVILVRSWARE